MKKTDIKKEVGRVSVDELMKKGKTVEQTSNSRTRVLKFLYLNKEDSFTQRLILEKNSEHFKREQHINNVLKKLEKDELVSKRKLQGTTSSGNVQEMNFWFITEKGKEQSKQLNL